MSEEEEVADEAFLDGASDCCWTTLTSSEAASAVLLSSFVNSVELLSLISKASLETSFASCCTASLSFGFSGSALSLVCSVVEFDSTSAFSDV